MTVSQELQIAYKQAYSIENMEGHGAAERSVTYIGSVDHNGRWSCDVYKDSEGSYWYKTLRMESEKIFTKVKDGAERKWYRV